MRGGSHASRDRFVALASGAPTIAYGGDAMDQRIIDLYDRFTHGGMNRRAFLDRLATLAGGAAAASALLPVLQNNYALAQTVPESDPRIVAETVSIPGVAGLGLSGAAEGRRETPGRRRDPRESRPQSAH